MVKTSESNVQDLLGDREYREAVILKVIRKQKTWGMLFYGHTQYLRIGPEISIIIKEGRDLKVEKHCTKQWPMSDMFLSQCL